MTPISLCQQLFQHLDGPADAEQDLAQVGPLPLYLFQFGLSGFKFPPQGLQPCVQVFAHEVSLPVQSAEVASSAE
jgi:hypothetical protein